MNKLSIIHTNWVNFNFVSILGNYLRFDEFSRFSAFLLYAETEIAFHRFQALSIASIKSWWVACSSSSSVIIRPGWRYDSGILLHLYGQEFSLRPFINAFLTSSELSNSLAFPLQLRNPFLFGKKCIHNPDHFCKFFGSTAFGNRNSHPYLPKMLPPYSRFVK